MESNVPDAKIKIERPGREIKIDNSLIGNPNVSVKVGTTDNKKCPQTVYLVVSYWVDIKDKSKQEYFHSFDNYISKKYCQEIKKIKSDCLSQRLSGNKYFPYYYDNIYTFDYPENLNYNNKRSFTTIELTLHTLNCDKAVACNSPYSLKNNTSSELYNELICIAKDICNTDLLKGKLEFKIFKSKN